MLEHLLTNKLCKRILAHVLEQPSWSSTRIARTIKAPKEYVQRVLEGKQSLQAADVEVLARAFSMDSAELIFYSMRRVDFPTESARLYDIGITLMKNHREFKRAMARKPVHKPRTKGSAKITSPRKSAKTSSKPVARRAFARS